MEDNEHNYRPMKNQNSPIDSFSPKDLATPFVLDFLFCHIHVPIVHLQEYKCFIILVGVVISQSKIPIPIDPKTPLRQIRL